MPKKSILTASGRKQLAELLTDYVEGVAALQKDMKARLKARESGGASGNLFAGLDLAWQSAFGRKAGESNLPVTKATQKHLVDATQLLLDRSKLGKRVSFQHVFDVLKQELGDEYLDGATKKPSVHKVIDRALKRLTEKVESVATHLFPVTYTREPKEFLFSLGPLDFMDFGTFEKTGLVREALEECESGDAFDQQFLKSYNETKARAKHVIAISVSGFETEKGRDVAKEAGEFFLNVLRLSFRWDPDKNPKILLRNYTDHNTPIMVIHENERLSKSYGGSPSIYSFLKEGVEHNVLDSLESFVPILSSIIDGMARAVSSNSPVLQRIEYASFLIASAFDQRSVRIALVNFVAALETLACLDDEGSKRCTLVERCRNVVLGATVDEQDSIAEAIENAYKARNAVVHGDAASEDDYWATLRSLEKWMLTLVFAFIDLLHHTQFNKTPKTSKQLRAAIKQHFSPVPPSVSPNGVMCP